MQTKKLFLLLIISNTPLKAPFEQNSSQSKRSSSACRDLIPLSPSADTSESIKRKRRRRRFGPPLPELCVNKKRRLDFLDHRSPKIISQAEEYESKRREIRQNGIDYFVEMAGQGSLDIIKELLEPRLFENRKDREEKYNRRNWIISRRDRFNQTALHAAAIAGHRDVIDYLLKKSERNIINKPSGHGNEQGMTALMYAALFGHSEVVEALLKSSSIDLNYQDELGQTALHLAARQKVSLGKLSNDLDQVENYETIMADLVTCKGIELDLQDRGGDTYDDILNSAY